MRNLFVGREAEMRALREAIESARAGRGAIVLISGERGVGKSSLASQFAMAVSQCEGSVLWGCSDARRPLSLWRSALRCAAKGSASDSSTAGFHRASLLPPAAISQLLRGVERRLASSPVAAQHRLLRGIGALCRSQIGLLAVVADDVDRSDAVSIAVLSRLSTVAGALPLVLVATYREEAVRPGTAVSELLVTLARRGAVRHLQLGGLDVRATGELLAMWHGGPVSPAMVRALHERTQGHPSRLIDLLRRGGAKGAGLSRTPVQWLPEAGVGGTAAAGPGAAPAQAAGSRRGGGFPPEPGVFRCEGHYWLLAWGGTAVRMRDSKGLRYIGLLLRHAGKEILALDLAQELSCVHPATPGTAGKGYRSGLSEPVLDARAKAAYRDRVEDLRDQLEEAERNNDEGRAGAARQEMGQLAEELRRATGLGGRDRRWATAQERARSAVTRRIRSALAEIRRLHPVLGRHLALTVCTGNFCAYRVENDARVAWEL